VHGGWSPAAVHSDLYSVHLLGSRAYELYPSVDCPADAYYLDAVHYVHGELVSYRRSACVFEQWRGTALRRRRRRGWSDEQHRTQSPRVEGLTDNVLVVRTVIDVDYNDYIIDVVFHQNAVIETLCSISGSLSTHYYYAADNQRSGYQVHVYNTTSFSTAVRPSCFYSIPSDFRFSKLFHRWSHHKICYRMIITCLTTP